MNKFQHKTTDQTLHQSLQNSPSTPTNNSGNYSFTGVNRSNGTDTPLLKTLQKQNFQQLQTPPGSTSRNDPKPVFSLSVDTNNENNNNSTHDLTSNLKNLPVSEVNSNQKLKSSDAASNSGCSTSSGSSGASSSASSSDETTTNEYMDLQNDNGETVLNAEHHSNSNANSQDNEEILPISASSTSCSSVSNSNEQVNLPNSISNGDQVTTPAQSDSNSLNINQNIPSVSNISSLLDLKPAKLKQTTSLSRMIKPCLITQRMKNSASASHLVAFNFTSSSSNENENVYSSIFETRKSTRKFISRSESNLMSVNFQDLLFNEIQTGQLLIYIYCIWFS